jgi:hypothetical protein
MRSLEISGLAPANASGFYRSSVRGGKPVGATSCRLAPAKTGAATTSGEA